MDQSNLYFKINSKQSTDNLLRVLLLLNKKVKYYRKYFCLFINISFFFFEKSLK